MKSLIAASLFLTTFSSLFASDDLLVNNTVINESAKELVVAVTTDYEAQSSLPFCKIITMPDGQGSVKNKRSQRVYFINEKETKKEIPGVFGTCKYTLQKVGVKIFARGIIDNLENSKRAKKVGDGVYEYKGSLGTIEVQEKDGDGLNTIKCEGNPNNALTFNCDKKNNEIFTNGLTLNLRFEAKK